MEYADDFFDYKGYGLGQDRDGCLFLVVTESRDYWFSTSGRGIKIYTPTAIRKMKRDVVKLLGADNYHEAFLAFLSDGKEFLALDARGRSYNFFHRWNSVLVSIAWALSLLTGFIVVKVWKKELNTALLQTHAAAYVVSGSLQFNEQKDIYLFSTFSRSENHDNDDSSGGGGSHTGSSGRSHGGGGGHY